MDPKSLALLVIVVTLLLPAASATSACPANQADFGPYNRVEILPKGYKLINEPFTVKAVRVDGKEESPLTSRSVKIYYYVGGTQKTLVASGTTNSKGEYTYTPTELGKYMVESSGRAPTFEVMKVYTASDMGAVCGNGICESGKLETRENCPVDCTICGDALCEGLEDKENCPDDCIICGDGWCDPEEYSPTACSCVEDCIICGDGICDTAHLEDCPADCGEQVQAAAHEDFLKTYWWLILIVAAAAVLVYFREAISDRMPRRGGGEGGRAAPSRKKKKVRVDDDDNLKEIINDLLDTGISDKRIKGKLGEFGLDEDEADALIEKAKRVR
jgi:hypothetical protein